jgi:hypothetical protein
MLINKMTKIVLLIIITIIVVSFEIKRFPLRNVNHIKECADQISEKMSIYVLHILQKIAKNRCNLLFNVTFSPIMSLDVTG